MTREQQCGISFRGMDSRGGCLAGIVARAGVAACRRNMHVTAYIYAVAKAMALFLINNQMRQVFCNANVMDKGRVEVRIEKAQY